MTRIIPVELEAALSQQDYQGKTSINLSNDNPHPLVKAQKPVWSVLASIVGIDLAETGYTARISVKNPEDGPQKVSVYGPYVALCDGVPAIRWGNVTQPLSEVSEPPLFVKDGYTCLLVWEDDHENQLALSMMVPKEVKSEMDAAKVNRAAKKGKLDQYLSEDFVRPISLSEVGEGTYSIKAVGVQESFGEAKPYAVLEDGRAIRCNAQMSRRLSPIAMKEQTLKAAGEKYTPEITAETPATLTLVKTDKEYNGHPVWEAEVVTHQDANVPAFSF